MNKSLFGHHSILEPESLKTRSAWELAIKLLREETSKRIENFLNNLQIGLGIKDHSYFLLRHFNIYNTPLNITGDTVGR